MYEKYNVAKILKNIEDRHFEENEEMDNRYPTSLVEDIEGGDNFIDFVAEYFDYIEKVNED